MLIGDIYNIIINGVERQDLTTLFHILLKNGENNPFIYKAIGNLFERKSLESVYATVRYLIQHRIYSLDQNLSEDDLIKTKITLKDAHLVIGLDPYETFKNLKFYSEKTVIILNTHIQNFQHDKDIVNKKVTIPSIGCIFDVLNQLVRRVIALDVFDLSVTIFKSEIYSPMIMLGLATKEFRALLNKNRLIRIINEIISQPSKSIDAFLYGYNLIDN